MSGYRVGDSIGRRRFLRRMVVQGTGLALLGALGTACASPAAPPAPTPKQEPAKPAAATAGAKPAAPATQAAPATAQRLSDLVVGIDSDPVSLDTRLVTPTQGYPMLMHFTEPLTYRDATGKVIPWLAESWERDGDLVWKLRLRNNVKFDNGESFDAESAKYSLDSIVVPDVFPATTAQKRGWLAMIEKVDIVDPSTIAIKTKAPSRTLLSQLSTFNMLPPRAAKELGEKFGTNPIGTGPYKVAEYVPGSRLVLEAKKDYWGGAAAHDKLTFRFLPEAATRVAALEAGEVALVNNLPPDQVDRIKNNANLDVASVMSTRLLHLFMFVDRDPFKNLKARQAINHAIDRDAIVKSLLGGLAATAQEVYAPSILYSKKQPPYEYDQNKARQLLTESGLAGAKITYGYTTGRFLNDKQIGELIGQQLEKLGCAVTPETGEWAGLFKKMNEGYFDIWFTGYSAPTLDPDRMLNFLYNSRTSWNKYNNPRVDELLAKGEQSFENPEGIYQELQTILWQDALNNWLYFQPEMHGVSKKLRNHTPRPDEYFWFKDTYVER